MDIELFSFEDIQKFVLHTILHSLMHSQSYAFTYVLYVIHTFYPSYVIYNLHLAIVSTLLWVENLFVCQGLA